MKRPEKVEILPEDWYYEENHAATDDGLNFSIDGRLWHLETRKRFLRPAKTGWYLIDAIHLGINHVDFRLRKSWMSDTIRRVERAAHGYNEK
jgi:hypothetical protein